MSTPGGPIVPLLTTRGAAAAQCVNPALVSLLRDRGGDRAINCLAATGGQGFGKSTLLTGLAMRAEGHDVSAGASLFPRGNTAEHTTTTCDVWTPLHSAGAAPNAAVPCLIDNRGDLKDEPEEDLRKLVLILAAMGPAARMVYVVHGSVHQPIMQALEATAALYAQLFTDDADAGEATSIATPAGPKLTLRLFVRTNRTQAISAEYRARLGSLFNDFGVFTCADVEGDPLVHDGYKAAVGAVLEWWQGAAAIDRLPSCAAFAAMLEHMKCDTGVVQPVPTLLDALLLPGLKERVQASVDTLVAERQVGSAGEREAAAAAAAAAVRAAEAGPSFARLSRAGMEQWEKFHADVLTVASARWDAALVQAQQHYTATMTTKLASASDDILKSGVFKDNGDANCAKAQLEKEAEALAGAPELGARLTEAQRTAWRSHIVATIVNPAFAAATDKVAKHKAEERRKYDASVVKTATETREREVGKETVPVYSRTMAADLALAAIEKQQMVVNDLQVKLADATESVAEAHRTFARQKLANVGRRQAFRKAIADAKRKEDPAMTRNGTSEVTALRNRKKLSEETDKKQLDSCNLSRFGADRTALNARTELKQACAEMNRLWEEHTKAKGQVTQCGTRVTRTLVRERRTTTTLGSGAVNHGNWVELARWTTVN